MLPTRHSALRPCGCQLSLRMAAPTHDQTGLQPLPPTPKVDIPESRSFRFKNKVLGRAMHTDQLAHERLGKPTALAVFASDNLSSAAYATEEILHTLLLAGVGIVAVQLRAAHHHRHAGGAGAPHPQLPPDDQGLPLGRWRLHRHQGQPRCAARPGRRRRAADRLHPHGVGVGVGRRGRPRTRCSVGSTPTGCRSPWASSPSSPSATSGA